MEGKRMGVLKKEQRMEGGKAGMAEGERKEVGQIVRKEECEDGRMKRVRQERERERERKERERKEREGETKNKKERDQLGRV